MRRIQSSPQPDGCGPIEAPFPSDAPPHPTAVLHSRTAVAPLKQAQLGRGMNLRTVLHSRTAVAPLKRFQRGATCSPNVGSPQPDGFGPIEAPLLNYLRPYVGRVLHSRTAVAPLKLLSNYGRA